MVILTISQNPLNFSPGIFSGEEKEVACLGALQELFLG